MSPRRGRDEDEPHDTLVDVKLTQRGVGGAREKDDTRDADLVGTMFGAYLVQDRLGGGAMGVVFRATHIDTNRTVALKVLHPDLLDEDVSVKRFVREARMASRLGHPHIGGVFELIKAGERYGLALELVEGEPLTMLLTMPLPQERVTLLVGQLLRGLEHAHAMGLVHRDLKPDNVLVEWRNGRDHARIIDFGIAIARDGAPESVARLTATGQIIGTPAYMSPEQARADAIDVRSDLYSLGTMMFEMLAGVLPFDGKPVDVLAAKVKRDPPRFEERVPGLIVDPLIARLCYKLLARDPNQRFATAREALTALDLIATDRAAADVALGIMDTAKAVAIVSLPPPPSRR
jgi:serine/threonine-protein kinase